MTAEIANLNKARKARAKADDKVRAAGNRVKFGRTKAEREQAERQSELDRERLEAHRRDD